MNFPIKNICATLALTAALTGGSRLLADDIIDYSNLVGTSISFNGTGGFSFTNTGGVDPSNIHITSSTLDPLLTDGLDGEITGNFSIGAITKIGIVSSANVTSTNGQLVIYDGSSTLTATLNWEDIVQVGTGSTLNDNGLLNLSNIVITGSGADPALIALKDAISATDTLDFTFIPAKALSTLKTSKVAASYSGSIDYQSVPDSASTALLTVLGTAAMAIGLMAQKRKARTV